MSVRRYGLTAPRLRGFDHPPGLPMQSCKSSRCEGPENGHFRCVLAASTHHDDLVDKQDNERASGDNHHDSIEIGKITNDRQRKGHDSE